MNHQDRKGTKAHQGGPGVRADEIAHEVIGAAIEVHRHLGPGFLESAYESAVCLELELRGIPFERQRSVTLSYKGRPVGEGRIDLLVGEQVVVKLKTVEGFAPIHTAQLISYLRLTGLRLGPLINFNVPVLRAGIRRVLV